MLYRIRKILEYVGPMERLQVHMPQTIQGEKQFGNLTVIVRDLSGLPEPLYQTERDAHELRKALGGIRQEASELAQACSAPLWVKEAFERLAERATDALKPGSLE